MSKVKEESKELKNYKHDKIEHLRVTRKIAAMKSRARASDKFVGDANDTVRLGMVNSALGDLLFDIMTDE